MRLRKTPALAGVVSLSQVAGYVGGPLAIARLGRRRGWKRGRPGPANLVGLVPLAAGAAMVTWAIVSHYETAPADWQVTIVPEYLVSGGAYRLTRNPMYVGGVAMQLGWAMLLGSTPVLAVAGVFLGGMDRVGIPFEERLLHKRFGASYDEYRRQVPRWL